MPTQVFSKTIAGTETTAVIDFGDETYERAYFARSTMATAAQFSVYGSTDNSTFFKVVHPNAATATTNVLSFVISSQITDCMIPIPLPARYVKFTASAAADASMTVYVVAHRKP